jgi:hypothetical protein
LSGPEFVDLRRVDVQKETIEHSPHRFNVIMNLETAGIHIPPLSGGQQPGQRPTNKKGPGK